MTISGNKSENYFYYDFPEKYWIDHNFCWYLHDVILSIFEECMEDDYKMSLDIKEKGRASLSGLNDTNDVIGWLNSNGYSEEANLILKRKLFHAILADFISYIYESLETSMKGKTAIAYTLLRKPFKDNLFYLEWLLFNNEELLELLAENKLEYYEIGSLRKNKKTKMKRIITNAYNINEFQPILQNNKITSDFFYDVRYEYNKPFSLELMWNKANHLVTTAKPIRSVDFNNIFLKEKDYKVRWDYYYSKIPLLLFYSTGIVIKLYEELFETLPKNTKIYNNFFIITKWFSRIKDKAGKKYFLGLLSNGSLPLFCLNCKKVTAIDKDQIEEIQYQWAVNCDHCKQYISIAKYHFINI
ncbi:hypothetical protein ACFFJQ_06890 [Bacillus capparidis]|uniref:Uncharacterized protein n=1 Tax=Bacillus capparidis TaxID=1840411 RepID=A0ABS4D1M0_9BACI|nr:hypothetical protein [Bacillus capparidis]MBP1083493.1 hypothetical protein [Bacillus capparidis]MED1094693.1 hypothetical protein [Bacillus capparidis]